MYGTTPVEVKYSLFLPVERRATRKKTTGKERKKGLSTVAAKGRKGLRKGHAPARAMYVLERARLFIYPRSWTYTAVFKTRSVK